jgi:hypothetical protein
MGKRGIILLCLLLGGCGVWTPKQSVTMPNGDTYKARVVSGTRVIIPDVVEWDRRKEPGTLDKMSTIATGVMTKEIFGDDD